jgi:heptaprenylglyceryl phosphate synthase
MDAEAPVFSFQQKTLANNKYYNKFKDLVSIAKWLGSNLGVQNALVETILEEIAADPDIPMVQERAQARVRAKDEYLAVMFLVNSDSQQYGALVCNIKNEYTRGSNTYPATLRVLMTT